jgi:integrase
LKVAHYKRLLKGYICLQRGDLGSIPGRSINLVSGDWLLVSGKNGGEREENPTTNPPISLEDLSKNKLQALRDKISEIKRKKYPNKNEKKYSNVDKSFSEEELKKFLKACRSEKTFIAFSMMAMLGLRVGEAVKVNLNQLDFVKNKIKILTEKSNTVDFLHLHSEVRKLLYSWVQKNREEILKHDGFIFFPDVKSKSQRKHISPDWLRNEFRKVCDSTGLNDCYSESEDARNPIKSKNGKRKLHRLTSHSLRHFFISKVYSGCLDPIKTQMLARHSDFKSTKFYIHIQQTSLDSTLKKIFENETETLSKQDLGDLIELVRLLRKKEE